MPKSLDRYISMQSAEYMRKQSVSLNQFGITGFNHDISFPNGEISILSSQENVFKLWFTQRIPAICTDEHGRFLNEGVYLDTHLETKYSDYANSKMHFITQFHANRILHILERDVDCQHLYSFLFYKSQESDFLHWVMNNINLLKNYIEHYKFSSQELISEAKKSSNRITLPYLKNNIVDESRFKQIINNNIAPYIIHKETKLRIYLSRQQNICLILLLQGKTAKEIASQMNLSFRTVQHYIERIRKTLGCASTKQLIIAYRNQVDAEKWFVFREWFEYI